MMWAAWNDAATRAAWATVIPFFMASSRRSEAASSPAVTATHPEAASRRQRSRVKAVSNRMFPHHVIATPRSNRHNARPLSPAGGAASSTKWNPRRPVSAISASMRSVKISLGAAS